MSGISSPANACERDHTRQEMTADLAVRPMEERGDADVGGLARPELLLDLRPVQATLHDLLRRPVVVVGDDHVASEESLRPCHLVGILPEAHLRGALARCAAARIPACTAPGSPRSCASAAAAPGNTGDTPATPCAASPASGPACTASCAPSSGCGSRPPSVVSEEQALRRKGLQGPHALEECPPNRIDLLRCDPSHFSRKRCEVNSSTSRNLFAMDSTEPR